MLIIKRPKNKYEILDLGENGTYKYFQGSLIPTRDYSKVINTKQFQEYLRSDIREKRIDSDEFFADRVTKLLREVSEDFFEILEIYHLDKDQIRELGILINEGFTVKASAPRTSKLLCMPIYWIHKRGVFIDYHGKNILARDFIKEKVNGMGRVNRLFAFLDSMMLWCDPLIRTAELGSGACSFSILEGRRKESAIRAGIQMWGFDKYDAGRYYYENAIDGCINDIEYCGKRFEKIVGLANEFGLEVIVNRRENPEKVSIWDHTDVNNERMRDHEEYPITSIHFKLGVGVAKIDDKSVTNFGRAIVKYLSENPGHEVP